MHNVLLLMVVLTLGSISPSIFAQAANTKPVNVAPKNIITENIAIEGYSVVSYFENDRAELGSNLYQSAYKGKTYLFTSSVQRDTFVLNPRKYLPSFNAFCPYSLTLGRKLPIDPTKFKIVNNKLLLFHASEGVDGLYDWNKAGDETLLLERAESEFFRLSI